MEKDRHKIESKGRKGGRGTHGRKAAMCKEMVATCIYHYCKIGHSIGREPILVLVSGTVFSVLNGQLFDISCNNRY